MNEFNITHFQALNANELVHLLKADALQTATEEQYTDSNTELDNKDNIIPSNQEVLKQDE